MALPTKNRLKNKKDFDVVFKKGRSFNSPFLFLRLNPTPLGYPRFGFIVASKFAPKAVLRNKIKRLFASLISRELLLNMPSCDTVVVVTKKVPEDLGVIKKDFIDLLRQTRPT
jgi:ribonuclease P protein component